MSTANAKNAKKGERQGVIAFKRSVGRVTTYYTGTATHLHWCRDSVGFNLIDGVNDDGVNGGGATHYPRAC